MYELYSISSMKQTNNQTLCIKSIFVLQLHRRIAILDLHLHHRIAACVYLVGNSS